MRFSVFTFNFTLFYRVLRYELGYYGKKKRVSMKARVDETSSPFDPSRRLSDSFPQIRQAAWRSFYSWQIIPVLKKYVSGCFMTVLVELQRRMAVSFFSEFCRGECRILRIFCALLRFSDLPYAPLIYWYSKTCSLAKYFNYFEHSPARPQPLKGK